MAAQQNTAQSKESFYCTWFDCQETFTRKGDMERHLDTQHLGKLHSCPVECGHKPLRKDKVMPHLLKKHGMKAKEVQEVLHRTQVSAADKTLRSVARSYHETEKTPSTEYTQTNRIISARDNNATSSSLWPQNLPPSPYSLRSLSQLPHTTTKPYAAYVQAQYNDGSFLRDWDKSNFGGDKRLGSGSHTLLSQTLELPEDSDLEYASAFSNYKY